MLEAADWQSCVKISHASITRPNDTLPYVAEKELEGYSWTLEIQLVAQYMGEKDLEGNSGVL